MTSFLTRLFQRLRGFDAAREAAAAGASVVAGPRWTHAVGFSTREAAEDFAGRCRGEALEAVVSAAESHTADVRYRASQP